VKFFILPFLLITFWGYSQDSLYIDSEIVKEKGKHKNYKYQSGTTGSKNKVKLKTGLWSYYDSDGLLLKTEEYTTSGKSSLLEGKQTYYNEDELPVLIRRYSRNNLVSEKALKPYVILLKNEILEYGDSIFVYYLKPVDYTWYIYDNVLLINTI